MIDDDYDDYDDYDDDDDNEYWDRIRMMMELELDEDYEETWR